MTSKPACVSAATAASPDMPAPITQTRARPFFPPGVEPPAAALVWWAGCERPSGIEDLPGVIDQLVGLFADYTSLVMAVKSTRRSPGRPRASERASGDTRRALLDAAA